MKHKLQRLKSILTMMTISLVSVFFILAFQATVRAAQPMVAAGEDHTLGLKSDGTVVAVGDNRECQCNVSSWTDIVQVAGWNHTVGLKSDGTVVAVGDNNYGQCNLLDWDLGPVLIDPAPDIKANGSDGPVSIPEGDPISVTIELDPGDYPGVQADWWCLAYAPFGWYYYDDTGTWLPGFYVSYQGPLFSLIPPLEVLSMYGLPIGGYTFYFGVDSNRNGNLDEPLYYDSVEVNITPP